MEPMTATQGGPVTTDRPEAYIPRDRRRALAAGRVDAGPRPRRRALRRHLRLHAADRGARQRARARSGAPRSSPRTSTASSTPSSPSSTATAATSSTSAATRSPAGSTATTASRPPRPRLAMQEAIGREGEDRRRPAGTVVSSRSRSRSPSGEARRFVVGDPDDPADRRARRDASSTDLAAAEHHAEQGRGRPRRVRDRVAGRSGASWRRARSRRGDRPRHGRASSSCWREVGADARPSSRPALPDELVAAVAPAGRLRAAVDRARRVPRGAPAGRSRLRPLRRHRLRRRRRRDRASSTSSCARRSGSSSATAATSLQLTLGDKGAYLYGVFGSPLAHEDDAARACAAPRSSCATSRPVDGRPRHPDRHHPRRLRSGTYGHAMRRTFVCLGDAVNLSARLMSQAPRGRIYVSELVRRRAGDGFIWDALPSRCGSRARRSPVAAYALNGSLERALAPQDPVTSCRSSGARRSSPRSSRASSTRLTAGTGRVVGISAEAGMGKSRLVAEFVRDARRRGRMRRVRRVPVVRHQHRLLRLARDLAPPVPDRRRPIRGRADRARSRPALAAIDPALVPRAPLLDARPRPVDPGHRADELVRREAAQDVAREPARRLPAGARARRSRSSSCSRTATGSTRSRATCSTCSRARVARPARAVRPRLPARGGARWRLGLERLPQLRGDPARPAGRRGRDGGRPREARSSSSASEADVVGRPRATSSPTAPQGNPFYVEELLNYIAGAGHRPATTRRLALARAPRQPAQPRPQPHRHAERGAAADAEGRERRRPRLPRARPARRLPGARDAGRRPRAPRRAPDGSTSSASTARPTRRTSSSTS